MIYLLLLCAALTLPSCGSSPSGSDAGPYGRIKTYAGTGTAGKGPEEASLRNATFYLPLDLTFGPDERPYILDWNNHRVRVVDQGRIRTLIGTGELGDAPAGPAREIGLNHPTHISFDPQGRLVLSAWHNSMILRYDFATDYICGTGERAYDGDDGPAELALVNLPSSTAFDPLGRMYISDQENQRIRMIDLDGTISTVVGTGRPGFSGDGGPAANARIYSPEGQAAPPTSRIAIDDQGTLYLADTFNNRIRKVTPDGIITTIAGNGAFPPLTRGALDDGAPALNVSLYWPCDVAIDSEGRVFFSDTFNHCIRLIDHDGTLTTIAGQCGKSGDEGDGGHPTAARLSRPYGIELDSADNLYIADTRNHRIRLVRK
jgi:DNA-binding beta-propeller fold protein YncE